MCIKFLVPSDNLIVLTWRFTLTKKKSDLCFYDLVNTNQSLFGTGLLIGHPVHVSRHWSRNTDIHTTIAVSLDSAARLTCVETRSHRAFAYNELVIKQQQRRKRDTKSGGGPSLTFLLFDFPPSFFPCPFFLRIYPSFCCPATKQGRSQKFGFGGIK